MAVEPSVVVVFRSRLRDGITDSYEPEAARMYELATEMPGFVSFKQFTAGDGERLSLIVFDSLEHERAWRDHPEHRRAQQRGRDEFYSEYVIQVCELVRERTFEGGG